MPVREIIGRDKEKALLDAVRKSKEAEFVAVYGRRRVGKTYLVREYFSDSPYYLEASGAKDKPLKVQLENFTKALSKTFFKGVPLATPTSWDAAFEILTHELERLQKNLPRGKKIVIFLDELPWMATKKSGLLQFLDYFWNLHWSRLSSVILIVCGSAASWMLEKLISAKGGLHKRITRKILLEPFTLREAELYLKSRKIHLTQKQILDLYMAIGGIPFYLKGVQKGLSASQNIESLCFEKNGMLYNEFKNLIESLFEHADVNLAIIREIVKQGNQLSREALVATTGIHSGGTLNKRIDELEAAGFVQSFLPYGRTKRDTFYRVVDEFSLFHLKWIEPFLASGMRDEVHGYWQPLSKTPAVSSWAGLAFESICFKHLAEIRKALKLDKVSCKIGSWRYIPRKGSKEEGVQIDLLFDRVDGAITFCEMKYCEKPFQIDKAYAKNLMQKSETFQHHFKTTKQLFLAMITTSGLKPTIWSEELVQQEITLKNLFT